MAKDIHLHHNCSDPQKSHHHPQHDPYIKVGLVPQDWFPSIHEVRTKTMKKSEPAVFEESFDLYESMILMKMYFFNTCLF